MCSLSHFPEVWILLESPQERLVPALERGQRHIVLRRVWRHLRLRHHETRRIVDKVHHHPLDKLEEGGRIRGDRGSLLLDHRQRLHRHADLRDVRDLADPEYVCVAVLELVALLHLRYLEDGRWLRVGDVSQKLPVGWSVGVWPAKVHCQTAHACLSRSILERSLGISLDELCVKDE